MPITRRLNCLLRWRLHLPAVIPANKLGLGGSASTSPGFPSWALPNPSVKPSPNGGPPGPGRRYAVHFRQPGPGVPPLVPAYLER